MLNYEGPSLQDGRRLTPEDLWAELARAAREYEGARGWRRLVAGLPWPLRVIPPFLAVVGVPILLLAVGFGAATELAGTPAVRDEDAGPIKQSVVIAELPDGIRASQTEVSAEVSHPGEWSHHTVTLTNTSARDREIIVVVAEPAPIGVVVDLRAPNHYDGLELLPVGESRTWTVLVQDSNATDLGARVRLLVVEVD